MAVRIDVSGHERYAASVGSGVDVFSVDWGVLSEQRSMADTVFYMRSSSPGGIVPSLNDQIIEDLRAFADVPDSDFVEIVDAISQAEPFLDRQSLNAAVRNVVSGDVEAAVVARVIRSLHRMENDDPGAKGFFERLSSVERADDSGEPALTTKQVELLLIRLEKLRKAWTGLERQRKAEALGKATGQRLQSVQLICDLRPVFNTERVDVEGWIPLTTMHIVVEGADGLPNGLDVVLSASDINKLAELASAAQRKLQVLRDTASQLGDRIPSTEITTSQE